MRAAKRARRSPASRRCAEVEGNSAQTLGALLSALATLRTLLREQNTVHTPQRWQQTYNASFDALLELDADDRDEARAIDAIRAALAALAEEAAAAGCDETLDWRCVRDFLTARLDEPERGHRFFSGGISVCGMLPLRAVPFRVICLIGMNEEAFPRRDRIARLDRMATTRRRGDRAPRDDDRYLFLQLLCSACEVFYLSWVGEEQRDGSAREPSAVVAELLDIAARQYCPDEAPARRALVTKHPLQVFSPRNFVAGDARVFTYRDEWRAAAHIERGQKRSPFVDTTGVSPTAWSSAETLDLDTLKRFFAAPARAFLQERLGMRLDAPTDAGEDADSLDPDGLEKYTLREALIDDALAGTTTDATALRARGLLPAGRIAIPVLRDAQAQATDLVAALHNTGDVQQTVDAPFELRFDDGSVLTGIPRAQRDGQCLRWCAGTLNGKRLLGAWIDYLALAASRGAATLTLFGIDKDKVQRLHFAGLTREDAHGTLSTLLQHRRAGLETPLLFFPKTSMEYARRWHKSKLVQASERHAEALAWARTIFDGAWQSAGEAEREPAFALIARDRGLFDAGGTASHDFAAVALAMFDPLLAVLDGEEQ